jgi:hypothetical protein
LPSFCFALDSSVRSGLKFEFRFIGRLFSRRNQ